MRLDKLEVSILFNIKSILFDKLAVSVLLNFKLILLKILVVSILIASDVKLYLAICEGVTNTLALSAIFNLRSKAF